MMTKGHYLVTGSHRFVATGTFNVSVVISDTSNHQITSPSTIKVTK